jgi:hypothetical protein
MTSTTNPGTTSSAGATTAGATTAGAGILAVPMPLPEVLSTVSGSVLTVGQGMEFATLGAALRDAVNGDTIAVQAGTYTNDFGTVNANVSIVAVGGMVNEVGTTPPPDGKGFLTVSANLNIQGFTFTGAETSDEYGNVTSIRDQAGNLNISYCDFHGLQDGLLVTPNNPGTGNVTIDHSTFENDGTGDGLTHDIYVGAVASFTLTNSSVSDADVGHEVKSRAAITDISHNIIADGAQGTSSYEIDVPNAGNATISDNIIEKGANASNVFAIHYGGETQYGYADNSLTVTGNTIINDLPSSETGYAVANQAYLNGASVSASLSNNQLYGFAPGDVIYGGAGTETNDTTLTTEPSLTIEQPVSAAPVVQLTGPERLSLLVQNQTVGGGASLLTVNDGVGSNTIDGGKGGIVAYVGGQYDLVTTAAGAADTVNAVGGNATVQSAGNDVVFASSTYGEVDATGHATIYGAQFDTYNLNGTGEVLVTRATGILNVGATASARVVDQANDIKFSVAAGGIVNFLDQADTASGGAASSATVQNGAASGWVTDQGAIDITTGNGGANVQAGCGTVSVTGGAGPDTLASGSGSAFFNLGSGTDTVVLGKGSAAVTGGSGADTYVFYNGANTGSATITGFKQGVDTLRFTGFGGNAIASGTVTAGSTLLTLTNGGHIDLVGVALPGYPGGGTSSGGGGGGAGSGGGGGTPTVSGGGGTSGQGTLTTSGQSVTGGGSLLTLTDAVGGNTIAGGSGGVNATVGNGDLVTTAAGAADTVSAVSYDTVTGAGTDQVTAGANDRIAESGAATVTLQGANSFVQGGAGLLQVSDVISGNTIAGGAGGVIAQLAGSYDQVGTSAGASDTLSLTSQDTVNSAGNDQISVSGNYNTITATGAATITSASSYSNYDLQGADSLQTSGGGTVTVGGGASAAINSTEAGGLTISKQAGGALSIMQAMNGGGAAMTISGGLASIMANGGNYAGIYASVGGGASVTGGSGTESVTSTAAGGLPGDTIDAGSGSMSVNTSGNAQIFGGSGNLVINAGQETAGSAGMSLVAGSGNVTLNGGNGNEVFTGGPGQAQLWLGSGSDTVSFGSGFTTVNGGMATTFIVPPPSTGTAVIMNWNAADQLVTPGATSPDITSQSVVNGSTVLTFAGGAHVELAGVTHFP